MKTAIKLIDLLEKPVISALNNSKKGYLLPCNIWDLEEKVNDIFKKRLNGESISREEEMIFKTAFMQFVGKEYHKKNWVMQIHYGCKRDNNAFMYEQLGPDTGYDCINNYAPSAQTADFLNSLIAANELPNREQRQQVKFSREVHGGSTITKQV